MRRRLGVNVDHVATVRQARRADYPDPVLAALVAEIAGAGQITVHLRADRRHIQERDLEILSRCVQTRLNVEMAATKDMARLALAFHPHLVTLVPERAEEVTTEGGLDVVAQVEEIGGFAEKMAAAGIGVSLFVDPVANQVAACGIPGVQMVELNTSAYSEAKDGRSAKAALSSLAESCQRLLDMGLAPAAGHGLNYHNVAELVLAVPRIEEYNIGHAIVARAIITGLEAAVREMVRLINWPEER